MPPAAADDDAFGDDLAVADQVLADDVLVIELALASRRSAWRRRRCPAEATELEAAQRR